MAAAGRDLSEVPEPEFAIAFDAYKREHIDPATVAIREELEELRAVPTLLRTLREKWAAPSVASLAIAAAMLDLQTGVAVATSAAGTAVAAREMSARRDIKRSVRQQPLWYLHQLDSDLAKRARTLLPEKRWVVGSGWIYE